MFLSTASFAQDINSDYGTFRNNLLNDYQESRIKMLDDYASYLEGIWKEYQSFRGYKKYDTPKPTIEPGADENNTTPSPHDVFKPEMTPITPPQGETPKVVPNELPIPSRPLSLPSFGFPFYGVNISCYFMETTPITSISPQCIADVWRKYQGEKTNKHIITSLKTISDQYGLNDWFRFELTRCYVDNLLEHYTSSDRIILQHFILTNLGYDIRLARTDRQLVLLVPFQQKIYERSYIKTEDGNYYIFHDNLSNVSSDNMESIYTCELPQNIDKGNRIDMAYGKCELKIEYGENKVCNLSDGRINIRCIVNSGMMEMFRHYPQMDIPYYVKSKIVPSLQYSIIEQVKRQVNGMSQCDAANVLLHFMQYAFNYATDGEQHGYEKPYFIEENFYYPKNDCEDRAIFYAFLVRNILGLNVHLIQFPGHECTAVKFTDKTISGDSYMYNGDKYIICDPTYIGASVGHCMPSYKNTKPIIEEW